MNKLFQSGFLLLVAMIIWSGCQKNEITDIKPSNSQTEIQEVDMETKEALCQLGFHTHNVQKRGESIIIDDDIAILPESFQRLLENRVEEELAVGDGESASRRSVVVSTGSTPTINATRTINVWIDPLFTTTSPFVAGTSWRTLIINALDDWEAITDCAIDFFVIPTPTRGGEGPPIVYIRDISILNDNNPALPTSHMGFDPGRFALACWPDGVQPGPFISINTDATFFPANETEMESAIKHEVGHCLGFHHTEESEDPTVTSTSCNTVVGFFLLEGTPLNDASSVMRGGQFGNDFNVHDRNAARSLFPNECIQPTAVVTNVTLAPGGFGADFVDIDVTVPDGTYFWSLKAQGDGYAPQYRYQNSGGSVVSFTVGFPSFVSGPTNITITGRNWKGDCIQTTSVTANL